MLNCHLHHLPTEFFTHPSTYSMPNVDSYQACMANMSRSGFRRCLSALPEACKQNNRPSEWCHREIEKVIDCFRVRDCSRYDGLPAFFQHRQCLEDLHQAQVLPCLAKMQRACDQAPVRLASTERLSMDVVTSLVSADPSVRVIHLVQDPRWILSTGRLHYFSRSPTQLCFSILRDVKIREKLESSYRDSFLQIKFEDVVQEPSKTARALHDFLGLPASEKATNWAFQAKNNHSKMNGIVNGRRENSTHTSLGWRNTLGKREKSIIDRACNEVLGRLQYEV